MATKKTAAKKADEGKALATTTPAPQFIMDALGESGGGGFDQADSDSYAIPFLRVLQSGSPEVDETKRSPQFIEEARAGEFINTVSRERYSGKEGVLFVPCAYQRRFLRWAPRGDSGGFRGELTREEVEAAQRRGELIDIDGRTYFRDGDSRNPKELHRCVDTRSHYGLVIDANAADGVTVSEVLLSLGSTQIKKSKMLMTLLANVRAGTVRPPMWSNVVRITTVAESNDEGSWYGVNFALYGFVQSPLVYAAGKEFYERVLGGEVKVDYERAGPDIGGAGERGTRAPAPEEGFDD